MAVNLDVNFISNRNIQFENKKGKWLTYKISENGTPVKLNIRDLINKINSDKMTTRGITGPIAFDSGDPCHDLALGIKHTIMERNVYVLNTIIDEKNKKMQTIWMKILNFIVKIFTCGRVNLMEKRKYKHIETTMFLYPTQENRGLFGSVLPSKVKDVLAKHPPLAAALQLKVPDVYECTRSFITTGGKLEDFIKINGLPGWSIQELYEMESANGYNGEYWIKGHQLDRVQQN